MNHRQPRKKGAATGVILTGAVVATSILISPAMASAAPSPADQVTQSINQITRMINDLSAPTADALATAIESSVRDVKISPAQNGVNASWTFDPAATARALGVEPSAGPGVIRLPQGLDLSTITIERVRDGVSEVVPLSFLGDSGIASSDNPSAMVFANGFDPSKLSNADFRSALNDLVRSGRSAGILPEGTTVDQIIRQITGGNMLSSNDLDDLLRGNLGSVNAGTMDPFALADIKPGDVFKISGTGRSGQFPTDVAALSNEVGGVGTFSFADLAEQMPDSPLKPFFVDFAKRLDETVDVWTRPMDDDESDGKGEDGTDSDILDEMSFNDAMKVYDAVDAALAEREKGDQGGGQGGNGSGEGQNNTGNGNTGGGSGDTGTSGAGNGTTTQAGNTIRDGIKTVPANNTMQDSAEPVAGDPGSGSDPEGDSGTAPAQAQTGTQAETANTATQADYPPPTDPNAPDSLPVTGASEGTAAMGWVAGILAALGISVAWASRRNRAVEDAE